MRNENWENMGAIKGKLKHYYSIYFPLWLQNVQLFAHFHISQEKEKFLMEALRTRKKKEIWQFAYPLTNRNIIFLLPVLTHDSIN